MSRRPFPFAQRVFCGQLFTGPRVGPRCTKPPCREFCFVKNRQKKADFPKEIGHLAKFDEALLRHASSNYVSDCRTTDPTRTPSSQQTPSPPSAANHTSPSTSAAPPGHAAPAPMPAGTTRYAATPRRSAAVLQRGSPSGLAYHSPRIVSGPPPPASPAISRWPNYLTALHALPGSHLVPAPRFAAASPQPDPECPEANPYSSGSNLTPQLTARSHPRRPLPSDLCLLTSPHHCRQHWTHLQPAREGVWAAPD